MGLGELRLGVRQLFLGHRAVAHQRLAPGQVVAGTGDFGLGFGHIGVAQADLCPQRQVIGIQAAHLAHCLGQVGLGQLQRHFGVGRVELHQGLAGFDEVGVVGQDGGDRAADLRRDLDDVALHVGVVGGLLVATGVPGVAAIGQTDQDDQTDHGQGFLACAGCLCSGGVGGCAHGVCS